MAFENDMPANAPGLLAAAAMGAGAGAVAALEIVLGNAASSRLGSAPVSCLAILIAFALAGAALGLAFGFFGSRLFQALRGDARDGAQALGFLGPALLLLPASAALLVPAFLVLRSVRRRFFPLRARLDSLLALALLGAAAGLLPSRSSSFAATGRSPLEGGAPVPGSIPVTITVHTNGGFPEIAAIHPPVLPLNAGVEEKRTALWTGRAPSSGRAQLWSIPGGGSISWVPPRPSTKRLLSVLLKPGSSARGRFSGGLEDMVRAANVPVLSTSPGLGDPPLSLRILEGKDPVSREDAERFRSSGAWIDVTLGGDERIRFSGEGFRIAPDSIPVTLLDVTPTVLHLLGLAAPRDGDGRILLEILDPLGPGGRSPRYAPGSRSSSTTER